MENRETRRKIIRQWTSLPKDKRQTEEQAAKFAKKAIEQNELQPNRRRAIAKVLQANSFEATKISRAYQPGHDCIASSDSRRRSAASVLVRRHLRSLPSALRSPACPQWHRHHQDGEDRYRCHAPVALTLDIGEGIECSLVVREQVARHHHGEGRCRPTRRATLVAACRLASALHR